MVNDMNTFELTDEQLDMVAGGTGNGSGIVNLIGADTNTVNFATDHSTTYGALISVNNDVHQRTSVDNSVRNHIRF